MHNQRKTKRTWSATTSWSLLISLLAITPAIAAQASFNRSAEETAAGSDARPTATWIGFRQTGPKSALVYVHLTDTVQISSQKANDMFCLTLKKTQVKIRNNRNPLIAKHFDTMVESVRLQPDGKDVKLEIKLKRDAKVSAEVVPETQGAVLYVKLDEQ